MSPTRVASLTLSALLVALPIQAIQPGDKEPLEDQTEPVSATADCALTGAADPDGAHRRWEVSRLTRLFAASHAVAPATGLGSVARRLRHVNYVDDEILGKMDAAGIAPALLSSDAEFLRRVTLDLTGRIPDAGTVAEFLQSPLSDKRARMIDQLLASDEFVDRWAFFYDELFRNAANAESGGLFVAGRNALHAYFVDAVRSRKPYDVIASELITASGDTTVVGAANFVARNIQNNGPVQDTYDNLAATTGTVFLGSNALFCTSCHNGAGHMDLINLWGATIKRQDFWGMSAYYARLPRLNQRQGGGGYTISEGTSGNYRLDTTTGNKSARKGWPTSPANLAEVPPKFIIGGDAPRSGESYRAALARALTSNPQFARAAVNYIWRELFTVGIVEPADAFDLLRQDPANPPPAPWTIQPTHPALLDRLAADYAGSGYDLRGILRRITSSSAYQLSSSYSGQWKDDYAPYFARHFAQRLQAEMLYDAVTRATGVTLGLTVGGSTTPLGWAMQLPDTSEPGNNGAVRNFLNTFLRGNRDTRERGTDGAITEALATLNDATVVTYRVKSTTAGSTVNRLITAHAPAAEIVRALYLSTLSRLPTPAENDTALSVLSNLKQGQTAAMAAEDLQFALINKLDFLFKY